MSLINSLSTGLMIISPQGRITASNQAAAAIFGCRESDLVDLASLSRLLQRAKRARSLIRALENASQGVYANQPIEFLYSHPEKRLLNLRASVSGLSGEGGPRFLLQIHDVTALVQQHQKELEALKKAHAMEQERDAFRVELASALAHQIRNPAIAIGGLARRLARGKNPEDPELPSIKRIADDAAKLEGLVEAAAGLAAPIEASLSLVEAEDIMSRAGDLARALAAESGKTVEVKRNPCTGRLATDPILLLEALKEVFKNSLAALPPAEGVISLSCASGASGWTIYVRDNGSGLDRELAPIVCDPFITSRADAAGMGLTRAASIMRELGGGIRLENLTPHGVEAALRLPPAATGPSERTTETKR